MPSLWNDNCDSGLYERENNHRFLHSAGNHSYCHIDGWNCLFLFTYRSLGVTLFFLAATEIVAWSIHPFDSDYHFSNGLGGDAGKGDSRALNLMRFLVNNRRYNFLAVTLVSFLAALILGCNAVGVVTAPTHDEENVPAEFKLKKTSGAILVYVRQPGWIKSPVDLRRDITDAMTITLEEKGRISAERLINYDKTISLRKTLDIAQRDEPFVYAKKLSAEYVIVIEIAGFELSTFAERNFYNGTMQTRTCLFDSTGKKLWPEDDGCRDITVGVEAQKGKIESVVKTFSMATAHCISRYYYKCKKTRFSIAEEKKYEEYTW